MSVLVSISQRYWQYLDGFLGKGLLLLFIFVTKPRLTPLNETHWIPSTAVIWKFVGRPSGPIASKPHLSTVLHEVTLAGISCVITESNIERMFCERKTCSWKTSEISRLQWPDLKAKHMCTLRKSIWINWTSFTASRTQGKHRKERGFFSLWKKYVTLFEVYSFKLT